MSSLADLACKVANTLIMGESKFPAFGLSKRQDKKLLTLH